MITISPALNGLIKGLLLVIILSVVSYFEDASHISGFLNPAIATLVAALASSLESYIKGQTGQGLFGAVNVK